MVQRYAYARYITNLIYINSNICDYIKYVAGIFERHPSDIVPVCAGESLEDTLFGIDDLKEKINSKTSDILELVIDRKEQSQDDRANKIIRNPQIRNHPQKMI